VIRRLIEEELPLKQVNAESAREKALRRGHISTMHLWWARRPLAMSRAVVFGSLLPDPGDESERKKVLELLALASPFEAAINPARIDPLRERLERAYPDGPPKVLDCFAGGGAIPLEALRLGCDTTAVDLNPVAYLIEKCVLDYPQRFGKSNERGENPLAEDFVKWAAWVRRRVEPKLSRVFPANGKSKPPAVYFWARTMRCPNPSCRANIPLFKDRWLDNNSRRMSWVMIKARPGDIQLEVCSGAPASDQDPSHGTVRASSVTCPGCGTSAAARDVREYGSQVGFGRLLYAVLDVNKENRAYRCPTPEEVEGAESLASGLLEDLAEPPNDISPLPDEAMKRSQGRRFANLTYGISTFRGLFNDRQLYVLGSLCEAVRGAYEEIIDEGMLHERAVAIATYLAFCIDRIADRNSSFCTWGLNPGGYAASVRNTFPQQAIRMAWNYVEIDPLGRGSGSWDGAVKWIEAAIRYSALTGRRTAEVRRGNAQSLPFPDACFDAVVVDPPYYDSFQYADLSDFFYVWLKRSIGHLYPELFGTPLTPKQQEIIESRAEKKSPEYISHEEFENRLQAALIELARVVKPAGVVSIVFAHTDVQAWERLLRGLRLANLVVSTSWPMRSEMANRPTALISAVLGSSVVLVCRPQRPADEGFYDDVVRQLEERIAERLDTFEEMGLVGADYFVSAIGPAFEVFARYLRIVRLSGEEVEIPDLMVLARQSVARHAMRRLLGPDSLAALDPESLFYLTWRWAYLAEPIPADEAYKIEKAFDVDLSDLSGPRGFAHQIGSNFVLLGPQDRKGVKLGASPPLIDVLHLACQLWDSGRRRELEGVLGATGVGAEPGFWSMARTLAEVLPDGDKERTMLLGLSGNRDALAQAAARAAPFEEPTLFDMPS
jgi:adenine-specific DNA methylase